MDNKDLRLNKWDVKPYSFWSFFRFLPRNIKHFFTRYLKYRRQRIRRGFADCDAWDLDTYILKVMADSLMVYHDQTIAWPLAGFDSFEAWRKYVKEISEDLNWVRVDSWENEFSHDQDKIDEWYHRAKEIEDEKQAHITRGLEKFSKIHSDIWW